MLQRELLEALDCLWLEGEEPEKGVEADPGACLPPPLVATCRDCGVSFDVDPIRRRQLRAMGERDPLWCYPCHELWCREF